MEEMCNRVIFLSVSKYTKAHPTTHKPPSFSPAPHTHSARYTIGIFYTYLNFDDGVYKLKVRIYILYNTYIRNSKINKNNEFTNKLQSNMKNM